MKYNKLISLFVATLAVVSCGSDDNDEPTPQPEPQPTKVLTSLKVDYSATVSQHLLDLTTVTVNFIGDNGQVVTEQMSSTTWSKSVTMPLPAKAGLSIQPTLKGSVVEGEYTLGAKGQMAYTWLDQDGLQLQTGLTEYTPLLEAVFYAEGIGQYLSAITASCQLARAFSKDYDVTETAFTWGGNASDDSTSGTGISGDGATGDSE